MQIADCRMQDLCKDKLWRDKVGIPGWVGEIENVRCDDCIIVFVVDAVWFLVGLRL